MVVVIVVAVFVTRCPIPPRTPGTPPLAKPPPRPGPPGSSLRAPPSKANPQRIHSGGGGGGGGEGGGEGGGAQPRPFAP